MVDVVCMDSAWGENGGVSRSGGHGGVHVRSASGADGWGEGHGDGCALGGGGCWEVVHVHLHLHLRDALREAETLCVRHVVPLCGHRLARWIRSKAE